jgi:AbrB family looped-hinge helix DNA binding protein
MKDVSVKLGEGGRIVIPADYRKALGIDVGDELTLHLDNGRMVLLTRKQAIAYVQEQLAKYTTGDVHPSEELIAERRKEAENE